MEVLEKNHGLDVYKDIENFPCECRSSEALFYKETKLLSRFYLLSKHSFSMLTGLFTKRPTYGSSGSNHNRNYLILQHRDGKRMKTARCFLHGVLPDATKLMHCYFTVDVPKLAGVIANVPNRSEMHTPLLMPRWIKKVHCS